MVGVTGQKHSLLAGGCVSNTHSSFVFDYNSSDSPLEIYRVPGTVCPMHFMDIVTFNLQARSYDPHLPDESMKPGE